MASKKFERKIREVAAKVMEDGEEFRAGIAGQAGAGVTAKAGTQLAGAQIMRAGATIAGGMFNALAILTDRNAYLIRTPMLKAFDIKEVVLKEPVSAIEITSEPGNRVRIGDYDLTYTFRMEGDAKQFVELASGSPPS